MTHVPEHLTQVAAAPDLGRAVLPPPPDRPAAKAGGVAPPAGALPPILPPR